MTKCNLHKQQNAKRVCAKCGKTFCDECAKQTGYTGFCVECEKTRQNTVAKYSLKKQVGYLSNTIACFVGAIIFLIFHFVFNDFKTIGIIGLCVMGAVAFLFLVLTVENGIKIKKAKKAYKKLCEFEVLINSEQG
ncbi:MAG: hypothetical protein IKA90_04740 [Clostridia bacterium]|nr:hypothetical protein [Clostridia bacterium]